MSELSSTYLVNQDDPSELARLIGQDLYMLQVTGLYPPTLSEAEIGFMGRVLDIGCGPGNWALMLAAKYQHLNVLGVDISEQMVHYAKGVAESREAENVRFEQMNALEPLPFPDHWFDLVNIRFGATWIPKTLYPAFLQECRRILKPGGYFLNVESENGSTSDTSPALAKVLIWLAQALTAKGLFFGNGVTVTITPGLLQLVKKTFSHVTTQAHLSDASAGEAESASGMRNLVVLLRLIEDLLEELGISKGEFEKTVEQLQWEIESPDLAIMSYMVSILAKR